MPPVRLTVAPSCTTTSRAPITRLLHTQCIAPMQAASETVCGCFQLPHAMSASIFECAADVDVCTGRATAMCGDMETSKGEVRVSQCQVLISDIQVNPLAYEHPLAVAVGFALPPRTDVASQLLCVVGKCWELCHRFLWASWTTVFPLLVDPSIGQLQPCQQITIKVQHLVCQ
jgi:hypothetical protein